MSICESCVNKDKCALNYCERYERQLEQTNEEWLCDYFNTEFRAMPTEKKAETIANFIMRLEELNCNKLAWMKWLKEVHK